MKLTKMSLVAALLISSSAFAIDNIKVSGDAKLFYSTQDDDKANPTADLFDDSSSTGEAAVNIGLTADLTEGVSAGVTLSGISTLGLYNNLVSATWTGGIENNFWFSEAWLAGTYGKTTAKVGRMQLDTPLVFTETWSVIPSTFEAAVLINQDIPDTTLVAGYIGEFNAAATLGGGYSDDGTGDARNDVFQSFYEGAYAIGAINNSFKPVTAQAWYYEATHAAKAYWLQADLACEKVPGLMAGAQYTSIDYDGDYFGLAKGSDNDAYAVMLGYEMKDTFTVKGSFSQVGKDKENYLGAGGNLAGTQSKLYTEAWWYYGKITRADTDAYNITVTAPVAGFDLGVYYTESETKTATDDLDFTEATFEVAKSFGPLDTGVYYIYTKSDDDNMGDEYNTVQVYLTYNF